MLVLLGSTLLMAVASVLRRRDNPARIYAVAIVVTLAVLILHLRFEWGFVAMGTLYTFAFTTALGAYVQETSRQLKHQNSMARRVARGHVPPATAVLGR
jgi:hypothetical protein